MSGVIDLGGRSRARLRAHPPVLAALVAQRVAALYSARAELGIDRAAVVERMAAELLAAADGLDLVIEASSGRVDLRLGPLPAGRGEALLSQSSLMNGNSEGGTVSRARVRVRRDGGEEVVLTVLTNQTATD